MDPEGESEPGFLARSVPFFLGAALVLSVIGFAAGWFSVNTKIEAWQFDPTQPESKGVKIPIEGAVNLDFQPARLQSSVEPPAIEQQLKDEGNELTYERLSELNKADTQSSGSHMLGVLVLHAVTFLGLAATAGF